MIARKNLLNKYLLTAVIATVSMTSVAQAAPKPISIKALTLWGQDGKAEAIVANSKVVITLENIFGESADIRIQARDFAGVQIWSKTIDSGLDEVATAMALDGQGTLWLAGNSATAPPSESLTALADALNPDSIVVENPKPLRIDMKNITIWQINAFGDLIGQSSIANMSLIDAIAVSSSGISILTSYESGNSLIALSQDKFSNEQKIGSSKTKLSALTRSGDGTTYLFGSSSETLGDKKLVGREDGVVIKVAKTGSITSVVRSSAPKSVRKWQSATSSLFVTGSVRSGNTVESALTKFNSSLVPVWTTRISSTGTTISSIGPNGSVYVILEPTSAIKGVTGLKIIKGQSVVLQFDSKGGLIAAFTSAQLIAPVGCAYSNAAGLFVLTGEGKILQIPAA